MGGYSTALNLGQFSATLVIIPIMAVMGTYSGLFLVIGVIALIIGIIYGVTSLFLERSNSKKKQVSA